MDFIKDTLSNLKDLNWYQATALVAIVAILGAGYYFSEGTKKDAPPAINQGGAQTSGASSTNSQNNAITL